jgi:transposase-like protein
MRKALGALYPETRPQCCCNHKTVNGLDYPPRALQPKAKAALQEICTATGCRL